MLAVLVLLASGLLQCHSFEPFRLRKVPSEFWRQETYRHNHASEKHPNNGHSRHHSGLGSAVSRVQDLDRLTDVDQQDVFKAGEEGYACFRIPAVVFTASGTFLAFAEGRGKRSHSCSDHGDVHIVVKRSHDNGKTWSPLSVVYEEYPKHTIGNPAPVFDRLTKKVILPFCRDNEEVFVTESADEGATWSSPRNITSSVREPDWGFTGTGPPGGIQLTSGRIVVGTYASGSYAIFSDDGGQTWKRSSNKVGGGSGECQVAPTNIENDTNLILFSRLGGAQRGIAFSDNGGETWQNATTADNLETTPCEGSIVAMPNLSAAHQTELLASDPDNKGRYNMTVFSSLDGGHHWAPKWQLWEGPSAYSSLTIQNGKVFCLYERGKKGPYEALTLAVI